MCTTRVWDDLSSSRISPTSASRAPTERRAGQCGPLNSPATAFRDCVCQDAPSSASTGSVFTFTRFRKLEAVHVRRPSTGEHQGEAGRSLLPPPPLLQDGEPATAHRNRPDRRGRWKGKAYTVPRPTGSGAQPVAGVGADGCVRSDPRHVQRARHLAPRSRARWPSRLANDCVGGRQDSPVVHGRQLGNSGRKLSLLSYRVATLRGRHGQLKGEACPFREPHDR
jgi:hypothetical protein